LRQTQLPSAVTLPYCVAACRNVLLFRLTPALQGKEKHRPGGRLYGQHSNNRICIHGVVHAKPDTFGLSCISTAGRVRLIEPDPTAWPATRPTITNHPPNTPAHRPTGTPFRSFSKSDLENGTPRLLEFRGYEALNRPTQLNEENFFTDRESRSRPARGRSQSPQASTDIAPRLRLNFTETTSKGDLQTGHLSSCARSSLSIFADPSSCRSIARTMGFECDVVHRVDRRRKIEP
jgi:hypothetical protein